MIIGVTGKRMTGPMTNGVRMKDGAKTRSGEPTQTVTALGLTS